MGENMRSFVAVTIGLTTITAINAFCINHRSAPSPRLGTELAAQNVASRTEFLKGVAGSVALTSFGGGFTTPVSADDSVVSLPSGVSYTVSKEGEGPKPAVGEMAAIRFKANVDGSTYTLDDIYDTPEPYYTRIGSGGLLKGVEEVLPKMRVGDRWIITVPTNMAFGPKGRPAS